MHRQWPHSPNRQGLPRGSYIVTCGTHQKAHLLSDDQKLRMHLDLLFGCAEEFGWALEAWAVFSNHYHFVASKEDDSNNLTAMINKLHSCSSRQLNRVDHKPQRKVWYQYRDTHLTFEKSYLARLNYVHTNPVKHGLVNDPRHYPFCSAEWFFQRADKPFYETVCSFPTDSVNVYDDY